MIKEYKIPYEANVNNYTNRYVIHACKVAELTGLVAIHEFLMAMEQFFYDVRCEQGLLTFQVWPGLILD